MPVTKPRMTKPRRPENLILYNLYSTWRGGADLSNSDELDWGVVLPALLGSALAIVVGERQDNRITQPMSTSDRQVLWRCR
jgi:hypothetical protein